MSETTYTRAENIVLRAMAGEHYLIVLDAGESKMFNLNETGLWFWQQLESPKTGQELLAAMLAEYDVDEATAADEIERFLAYLAERALVTRC